MMGLGKRSMGDARIANGGMMMVLGKRAPHSISEGGMMMGLGKRAPHSISEGGMMMGLGKRAGSWRNFIPHAGMMTGSGERREGDYINGIDQRHVWQPVYY